MKRAAAGRRRKGRSRKLWQAAVWAAAAILAGTAVLVVWPALAASADHDDVVITVEITPLGSEGTSQTGQDTANPTDWNLDPSGSGGVPTSSGGLPTGASPTGDEPGNKLPGAGASIVWLMVAALGLTGAGAWLRRRQAQLGD